MQIAKNPKGAGRPYSGGRERTTTLQLRLTEKEHSTLFKHAKATNTTVSELVRKMLSNLEPTIEGAFPVLVKNQPSYLNSEEVKDLYKQLTKILIGE